MIFPKKWCFHPVLILCLAASLSLPGCRDRGGVERTRDANGVEIVHNPLHPVKVNGRQVTLELEEEIVIDTENDAVAKTGLGNIAAFAADSKGNIYILSAKADPGFIFQFDAQGRFQRSFGRQGQGPGELQAPNPLSLATTDDDAIAITDMESFRLCVYNAEGMILREKPLKPEQFSVIPLPNGNHFVFSIILHHDPEAESLSDNIAGIGDSSFKQIRELDSISVENVFRAVKFKGTPHQLSWGISRKSIVTGNSEGDYEIRVFDHEGQPLRIIQKEYSHFQVPDEYKRSYLKQFDTPLLKKFGGKIYFPDAMPPFEYLFADEEGNVFLMTFESGEKQRERMCDVFNPDGLFISRISIPAQPDFNLEFPRAKAKNGRLYCLREKASGFQELVVYKMIWK